MIDDAWSGHLAPGSPSLPPATRKRGFGSCLHGTVMAPLPGGRLVEAGRSPLSLRVPTSQASTGHAVDIQNL